MCPVVLSPVFLFSILNDITFSCIYLFLTPNSRSALRAGVSLNIHSFISNSILSRNQSPVCGQRLHDDEVPDRLVPDSHHDSRDKVVHSAERRGPGLQLRRHVQDEHTRVGLRPDEPGQEVPGHHGSGHSHRERQGRGLEYWTVSYLEIRYGF